MSEVISRTLKTEQTENERCSRKKKKKHNDGDDAGRFVTRHDSDRPVATVVADVIFFVSSSLDHCRGAAHVA